MASMRELLRAGWPPRHTGWSFLLGLIVTGVLVVAVGPTAFIIIGAFFALVTVAYVGSLLYVRFTAKGQAAWVEHREKSR